MKVYDYNDATDYVDRSLASVYEACVRDIVAHGWKVGPRGKATLELNNVALVFPQMCGTVSWKDRKLNPFFLLSEALWILCGADETSLLEPHMPSIVKFYDEGRTFGAYGPRFRDQIQGVIDTLKEDPESRQAVFTLWRPSLYTNSVRTPTRDVPCTVMMHFRIFRHPQASSSSLNATVYMRSNDMYKGFPYDVFNFGMIQGVVAAALGVNLGTCTHIAGSAHVYQEDLIHVVRHGQKIPSLNQSWSVLSKDLAKFDEMVQDTVLRNLCQMRDAYREARDLLFTHTSGLENLMIPTGISTFDMYLRVLARRLDAPPRTRISIEGVPSWLKMLLEDYYGSELIQEHANEQRIRQF